MTHPTPEQLIAENEALKAELSEARAHVADWEADRNEWGRQVHDQIDSATTAERQIETLKTELAASRESYIDADAQWMKACRERDAARTDSELYRELGARAERQIAELCEAVEKIAACDGPISGFSPGPLFTSGMRAAFAHTAGIAREALARAKGGVG